MVFEAPNQGAPTATKVWTGQEGLSIQRNKITQACHTIFGHPLAASCISVQNPIEKVLNNTVSHAVAHEHDGRMISLPHRLDFLF